MTTETKIISSLKNLNEIQKQKLLSFIEMLFVKKLKPVKHDLEIIMGGISKEDLELMQKAIEENCEKIDYNEW